MSDPEGEEEPVPDCSDGTVLQHYLHVGQIVTNVITELIKQCVEGASVHDLCVYGDGEITKKMNKTHKATKEKGVAFPTCISVNHIAGHYCPLRKDGAYVLQSGDVVKINLGAHFDGFCVCMAHTVPIGAVEGKKADVIRAAWEAAQATKRLVTAGKKNHEVTDILGKCADDFKVNVMDGVLSHETKQYVIDHENCIISKPSPDHQVDEHEFEANKVMIIDTVMTTGHGKPAERAEKCTIYKRVIENKQDLKVKAARTLITKINKDFPCFPFTLRALDPDTLKKALLGVKTLKQHDLIQPYPVLSEKPGDFIAQFKYTALLLPSGTKFLEPPPLDLSLLTTDKEVTNQEVKDLLAQRLKKKKKKKKRKKPAKEAEETAE